MLRPFPATPPRTLDDFRRYTESWRRPAAEEPRAAFRVWQTDEGPPSHSVPPLLVSKAAERIDRDAWRRLHWLLLEAYFRDNRDVTSDPVLGALWVEAGLPAERFEERADPALAEEVVHDHNEALEHGATGVPAVRLAAGFGVLTGAHSVDVYRQWVERAAEVLGGER